MHATAPFSELPLHEHPPSHGQAATPVEEPPETGVAVSSAHPAQRIANEAISIKMLFFTVWVLLIMFGLVRC